MAGMGGGAVRPGLFDLMRQGAAWWADELRACVPVALKAKAGARTAAIDCVLFPDGRAAAALHRANGLPEPGEAVAVGPELAERLRALAALAPRRTVRLTVPRALCLVRQTRLPLRALPHAGAILRHEAETRLPLPPADILTDWYVETEDPAAREIHLVQAVLARPRIERLEEAIAAAGLALTRLTVGDGEGRPMPVDLLAHREPSLRAALFALPVAAKLMLGAAAMLVVATPFIAEGRQDAALAAMRAVRAGVPKPTATALSAVAVADFLDANARRPPLAALLDEIARRLPRNATLTQLVLDGDRLALGLDGSLPAARAVFAASPLLRPEDGAAAAEAAAGGMLVLRVLPLPERAVPGDAAAKDGAP